MIVKKFTCKMHEDHGFLGWVLNTMPHFDPATGMGVAHDCLEHLTRRVGFEGEMEAFGVSLWIRGEGGYWQNNSQHNREWFQNTCGEVAEFLAQADGVCQKPPRAAMLEDWQEEQLQQLKAHALKSWDTEELADRFNLEHVTEADLTAALENVLGWVRRGFHAADKKYTAYQYDVCYMFQQIEKEVDDIQPEEGDTLTVTFSRSNTDWTVKHKSPYGY